MTVMDVLRKIYEPIRRRIHMPDAEINKANIVAALALITVATIALLIRILPGLGFETILRAFDPWYNFRETEFILEYGFGAWFSWYDTTSWVPFGRDIALSSYPGIPFTTAFLYLALWFVGVRIDLMLLCVLFPALMGTLGVVAAFFLGREVANKEVGLFAAFFMAIVPSYTQRTIVGFYDNEAIGIFAIILTLFFFCRALRKGSVASAVMGGLSLGYLAASWSSYIYIFELLALFSLLLILLRRYSRRLLVAYSGTIFGGMLIAVCVPRIGPSFIQSTMGLIPIGVFGLMVLIEVAGSVRLSERGVPGSVLGLTARLRPYAAYVFGGMCALVVVGLGFLFQSGLIVQVLRAPGVNLFSGLAGKFQTVLDPFIRQTAFLLASVGEHLPSPWASFWYNLGFLMLLIPFGLYTAFRREREVDLLLILFTLTGVYFTGSMIRLALLLAPAAALVGAYGLVSVLTPFRTVFWQRPILTRRRRRITPPISRGFATVTYILVLLLLMGTVLFAINGANNMGSPEMTPGVRDPVTGEVEFQSRDYLEAFGWMRSHTAPDAIFASWWDYGYWTRVMGNRSTVVDNATVNKTQIGWIGRMFMENDPIEALRICRRFDIDYVFVHFGYGRQGWGGDEGKWQWMARISYEVFGDEVPDEFHFWDPTRGTYHDAFYNSLLYNMLFVNASAVGVDPETWPEVDPTSGPALSIFEAFPMAYQSEGQLMKIYKPDYTRLDSEIEIRGASAYPVHGGPLPTDPLSSIILEVANPGLHPFTISSVDVRYYDETQEEWRVEPISIYGLTTSSGEFEVQAGESVILCARVQLEFPVGSTIGVTVKTDGFLPPLNATAQVLVRSAPSYNVTAILSECYAYDNGTIHVVLENTGEGYCEIDRVGRIDGQDLFISDDSDRGLVLFTGEQIVFNFDADEVGDTLTAGDDVKVELFYMALVPEYLGQNVTLNLTVLVTPTPSQPNPSSVQDNPMNGIDIYCDPSSLMIYEEVSSLSCCACSAFFIARRYFP